MNAPTAPNSETPALSPEAEERIRIFNEEDDRLGRLLRKNGKAARDAEFFRRTPKFLILGAEEAHQAQQDAAHREDELFAAVRDGISVVELRKRRTYWSGVAEAEAAEARKIAEKKAKKRLADKARRDRRKAQRGISVAPPV